MNSDDPDLSLVAPHRRDEVRRRIGVLSAYVKNPSVKAAKDAAADLGLSLTSFYTLVRAWSERRAELLPGAGRSRQRKDDLTEDQRNIFEEVAKNAQTAVLQRAIENAEKLAKARGVAMPSWNTARRHLRKLIGARLSNTSIAAGATYAVDYVALDVPVKDGTLIIMPVAAIVLRIDDAAIVGVDLSSAGPSPKNAMSAIEMARSSILRDGTLETVLALEIFPGDEWRSFLEGLRGLPVKLRVFEREALGRKGPAATMLPAKIAGISLKPRLAGRDRQRRLATLPAGAEPLTLADANAFVRERWAISGGGVS
ncbi:MULTISPECIES: hypothetical protein [unclassified Sphingopyxis]|uniref:hypothetical protein n=1 Tax=unclassified Sphingopyxis TaxID=2614943 RepID=UPI00286217F7|nr:MULTISPECIES: hypothetical protein [unclassified Sphingopyxis]MDR6831850.1 transposase [Sphingopyxis sp. BE122]MDR7227592.1 transposase [Sphingopyxis sp. BE259]